MVNEVTFVGFRGVIAPIAHTLDPPLSEPNLSSRHGIIAISQHSQLPVK